MLHSFLQNNNGEENKLSSILCRIEDKVKYSPRSSLDLAGLTCLYLGRIKPVSPDDHPQHKSCWRRIWSGVSNTQNSTANLFQREKANHTKNKSPYHYHYVLDQHRRDEQRRFEWRTGKRDLEGAVQKNLHSSARGWGGAKPLSAMKILVFVEEGNKTWNVTKKKIVFVYMKK